VAVTSETQMPGYSSENYSPLFDIIGNAVLDKNCHQIVSEQKVISNQANLPEDLKAFLKSFSSAVESKNSDAILDHYSNDFLHSGRKKSTTAKFLHVTTRAISKCRFKIDQCRIKNDKAKIWGKIDSNMGPMTLAITDLIKEDKGWKWYGNQLKK